MQKLAVTEALSAVEKERDALANRLGQTKHANQIDSKLAEARLVNELQKADTEKGAEIQDLKAKLDAIEIAHKLAITDAVNAVEKERDELKNGLEMAALQKQLAEKALKDKFETQIKDREDTIERLRDMKAGLSTKMAGETLEQHCETEFNRIRVTVLRRRIRQRTSLTSSIRIVSKRDASMRYCSLSLSLIANFATPGSSIFFTATLECISSAPNFFSR